MPASPAAEQLGRSLRSVALDAAVGEVLPVPVAAVVGVVEGGEEVAPGPAPEEVQLIEPAPVILLASGGEAGSVVEGMGSEATGPADDMPLARDLMAVAAAADVDERLARPRIQGATEPAALPPFEPGPGPVSAPAPATPAPEGEVPSRTGGCSHSEPGARVWAVVASAPAGHGATTGRAFAVTCTAFGTCGSRQPFTPD